MFKKIKEYRYAKILYRALYEQSIEDDLEVSPIAWAHYHRYWDYLRELERIELKDKATGERKERTEWHRVVIFNPQLADTAERYLRKGSKVYLEGSLQTRQWKDNNGNDRYTTEVVLQNFSGTMIMLDARGDNAGASMMDEGGDVFAPAGNSGWDNSAATSPSALDDDIPF